MITIRPATEVDVPAITDIYNEAILTSTATFDTEIKSVEDRMQWFKKHGPMHPVLVAELDHKVVGWASLSQWSDKKAYETTVEGSFYVMPSYRGRGIGKKLIEVITLEGSHVGVRNILSRITEGNEISIHLHEALGYEHIGRMKMAGKKFGKFLDVHLMQKVFPE